MQFRSSHLANYPVLKRLIIIQTLIGVLGILLAIGMVAHFRAKDKENILIRIRQNVAAEMQKNQDRVIAWRLLNMEGPIQDYEAELKAKFPGLIKKMGILMPHEPTPVEAKWEFVLVGRSGSPEMNYRMFALIDPSHIEGQNRSDVRVYSAFVMVLVFFLLLIGFALMFIGRKIYWPLSSFNLALNSIGRGNALEVGHIHASGEIKYFIRNFEKIYNQNVGLEREAALAGLASQVAHDIRSPLAALGMLEKDLSALSEDRRILLRTAINRIRDIANDLLDKRRKQPASDLVIARDRSDIRKSNETVTCQLLSALIDSLVTEKRIQFGERGDIEILGQIKSGCHDVFVELQASEFKRVLSNLINNAVESIEGARGSVCVSLKTELGYAVVEVIDNGKGIPPPLLTRLFTKGFSAGKEEGSGLGLFHAQQSVNSWKGTIALKSAVGVGTTAVVKLPRIEAPDWFATKLFFHENSPILVLDDDQSVHQLWRARLNSDESIIDSRNSLHHCQSAKEFVELLGSEIGLNAKTVFLIDFELPGSKYNGLDLIARASIADRSILITSRFDESQIRSRCKHLGVKVMPKSFAAFVPIEIIRSNEKLKSSRVDPSIGLNV